MLLATQRVSAKMLHGRRTKPNTKITVAGAGSVGLACSAFLIDRQLTNHLVLMDRRDKWLEASAVDLQAATKGLSGSLKVEICSDGAKTKNSKYVVIAAGERAQPGQSRLQLAQATANAVKQLLPKLLHYNPRATYVVASSPADLMTWLLQELSGLPKERCISAGCHLDSILFRYLIAQRMGVAASAVNGFIIGEHGNCCVPVWSGVSVGGISLQRLMPEVGSEHDKEQWQTVHRQVQRMANQVARDETYTNWGIGISVSDIIGAMQQNLGHVLSVGGNIQGLMGITDSVVLSLPSVLGANGIKQMIELPLSELEMSLLEQSAESLVKTQQQIQL
ncbi:maker437 [Drosophila busckii]|uniref:Maker437 n=2 Tax=Drosophila busckii TaxID=30019 RepID=A0A0M4E9A9_DROBS|nr:maker437 [Drosophila busckii]